MMCTAPFIADEGYFVLDSQATRMQIAFTFSTLFRLTSVNVTVTLTMKPELIA